MAKWKKRDKKEPFFNQRRISIAISLFIVIIMISSILALFQPSNDTFKYNDHIFYNTGNGWFTKVFGQEIPVLYLPNQLENISISYVPTNLKLYLIKNYSSFDTKVDYFDNRYRAFLLTFTRIQVVDACFNEKDCPDDYPIVNCNKETSILYLDSYLNESKKTTLIKNNSCYNIKFGNDYDLVTEKLIYQLLGVMN